MKIVEISSEGSSWDSFVESTEDATLYHLFGWKDVIAKSFGHKSYYLAAVDRNGAWRGVLPLVRMSSRIFGSFMISVPFVTYGGLLCNDDAAGRLFSVRPNGFGVPLRL
jgi:hypothetical protein